MTTSARAASALLAVAALSASVTGTARAADAASEGGKEQCRTAYERGQIDRSQGHLRAALTSFRSCSVGSCAPFMRSDCARWIDEVSADLPTLVVAVRDASGEDVPGARLLVDGEARPELARGTAIALDPGDHQLRAEAAGMTPAEVRVVVRVGERERRVGVTLAPAAAAIDASFAPGSPSAAGGRSGAPAWPLYALGGLALAGFGTFTGFAVAGHSIQDARAGSCAPSCSDAQVSPIHTDYRVADVALGIGIASVAAAVVYFLVAPRHEVRRGVAAF